MDDSLKTRLKSAAFSFRGYNVTNLGKSPELLAHRLYGPMLERRLIEASQVCANAVKRQVDLVHMVRERIESTLDTYAEDLAMSVAVELAQLDMLREFFDAPYEDAKLAFGYSLGEVTAVIAGGVFSLEAALTPLMVLAEDSAELAHNVSLAVVFSRGPAISYSAVEKLCLEISNEGNDSIGISSYLSPNTVLILGQGETLDRFRERMKDVFPEPVHLRKNPHRWPPMHTWICRQKHIADRAWVMLEKAPGGFTAPKPPIVSCVTGEMSYNEFNSRKHMSEWVDTPQKLWDVIARTLEEGVETVIHAGAEPNIAPATFNRLSINVQNQLAGRSLSSLGLRAVSRITRARPWLSRMISSNAALLRAPFIEHIILEDWLLAQELD